jgi:hypothetical protein
MSTEKILSQIREIENLKKERDGSSSPKFNSWQAATERYIKNIFGPNSDQLKHFQNIYFTPGSFIMGGDNTVAYARAYLRGLEEANLTLTSFLEEIPRDKQEPTSNNSEDCLKKILNKFHAIAVQLKRRHDNRETLIIGDEYDVQNLLHALLRIDFTDIRAEEWTPSYAGGSARMDFLLPTNKIAIEVKKTRKNLKDKEVGQELTIDISYYQNHPNVKKLICFIYDPENLLRNPNGLESDLTKQHNNLLHVEVIVNPSI